MGADDASSTGGTMITTTQRTTRILATAVAMALGTLLSVPAASSVAVTPAAVAKTVATTAATTATSSGTSAADEKAAKKKAAKKAKALAAKKAAKKAKAKLKRLKAKAAAAPALKLGDTGASVRRLKKLLLKTGYWIPSVSSTYTATTAQAVLALQKSLGFTRDSKVGKEEWLALFQGRLPKATKHKGWVFEVDLSKQVMMRTHNGKVTLVFNVSTGSNQIYYLNGTAHRATTPKGTFRISRKIDGMRHAALGTLYRPQYFRSDGYAIHGSPSIPAYPASHGCVRVSNSAIDFLWTKAGRLDYGSKVSIHQ